MQPRHEGLRGSISHYDLLEKVGSGGMGVVYRAHDRKLDRIVALKFLHDSTLESPAGRERFMHEARTISRLNHRHIAVIHAIEECDGEVFLVFEYLPGGTLRSRLDELRSRGELMSAMQVATYGLQIGEALSYAHAVGIIHRDIKPGNIMFARDGDLKIVDFGMSRLRGRAQITQTGAILGTPLYMSPEQAQGKGVDERSDIFSLGVVLFEMATGHPPFASDQPEGIVHQIIHKPIPLMRAINSALPPELDNIVGRALEKNPDARYPRILDMADELRGLCSTSPARADLMATEAIRSRVARSKWRRTLWGFVGILVAGLMILLLGPLRDRHHPNSPANRFYDRGTAYLYRFYIPGNADKAIAAFGSAIQNDPTFTEAYAALSKAYLEKYLDTKDRQFLDDARANANKALGLNSSSAMARVASGAVLDKSGDHENAIVAFRRALSSDPASVEAMRDLATVYDSSGNAQAAEALYTKALKINPNDWDSWSETGVFHYGHQRYSEAEKDFRTAIALAPDSPAAHRNLGGAAMALGKYQDAEKEFLTSAKLGPTAAAYSNLGALYIYQGRYQEAIGEMEEAIRLSSSGYQKMHILWANLAEAYRYTPEQAAKAPETYRRAIQEIEKQLAFAPDDPDLLSYAAGYCAKVGDRGQALDEIGRAIGFAHGNSDVSFRAAVVYELTGSRERAMAALADAIRGGYSMDEIEKEPALRKLRQDHRYRQLVPAQLNPANKGKG